MKNERDVEFCETLGSVDSSRLIFRIQPVYSERVARENALIWAGFPESLRPAVGGVDSPGTRCERGPSTPPTGLAQDSHP